MASDFVYRPRVRFFEVDQQRVIYHMWYLAYFEDARNALLDARGIPLRALQAGGHDLQVVHYELDWAGPIGWDDDVEIVVEDLRRRTRSFAVGYSAWSGGVRAVSATAVYAVTDMTSRRAVPIPAELGRALWGPAGTIAGDATEAAETGEAI